MTQEHPITPPPELVQQWVDTYFSGRISQSNFNVDLAAQVAQWGADQELDACCAYLMRCAQWEPEDIAELRASRRPKPPSLKEQALQALAEADLGLTEAEWPQRFATIRRALEQLDD